MITGITGFAGPHLARVLLDEGAKVYGLVRRRSDGNLARGISDLGITKQVEVIEGSVEDIPSLLSALDRAEPDYVFHLAAQSFVERSFVNPLETFQANATGTTNILEAVRIKDRFRSRFVFAGSSEEYGMVIPSEEYMKEFGLSKSAVFPPPQRIPELPVSETNPLRPLSPYAVTKVYGEYATLNFQRSYGLDGLVTRAFNHEGARRGRMFVTSVIARQVMRYKYGETDMISLGNVEAFRDWSFVSDIVEGYKLAAMKGGKGEVYNLGAERTNSVLTYLLWSLVELGIEIRTLTTLNNKKRITSPAESRRLRMFGRTFRGSAVDELMLNHALSFDSTDKGFDLTTSKGVVSVRFDANRFRPADVPILMSDCTKAKEQLGFSAKHSLNHIIRDQLNSYVAPEIRQ